MMASHDDEPSEAQPGSTGTACVPGATLRRGASRPGILHRMALGVVAVILMGLGIWILVEAVGAPGPAFARVGVAAIGLSLSAAGLWFGARAVGALGRRGADEDYSLRVKERAEQLGLPTQPEAYQDGGLAVAATAYGVERAEIIAGVLRGAGIPAWVEGGATAGWYWHLQFAMHPRGIRVLVPNGRLEDARAVLAERREIADEEKEEDQVSEESAEALDPGEGLFRWAKRLFILLFLSATLTAPFVYVASMAILIIACRRLTQARSAVLLKRAIRWSMVTAGIAATVCVVLVVIFTRASCSSGPPLMETEDGAIYIERRIPLP